MAGLRRWRLHEGLHPHDLLGDTVGRAIRLLHTVVAAAHGSAAYRGVEVRTLRVNAACADGRG